MRFLALGTLVLATDQGTFRAGSPREQTVLAALLLDATKTISVERLVDVLWADSPPSSARTQVAISISSLRRTFETAGIPASLLVTQAPGYRLDVPENDIDIRVFERGVATAEVAAAEGKAADAVTGLSAALDLWRGRPFDGLHTVFIEAAAARLEDQRLTAIEQRLALELDLGRHEQVVGELRKLVDEHPHRERLVGHLMLALYRCGRQVEALDAYQRVRRVLDEELGLAPGDRLQHLHKGVLAQDPALAAPEPPIIVSQSVVPRQLPGDLPDIAGRVTETAQICAPFDDADPGAPDHGVVPIALIVGAGGVGKSTLAVHAAHAVRNRYPDGQLYVDLRGVEPVPLDPSTVIAGFLRALGYNGAAIPDTREERAALYRSALSHRRMLVLLDNAASESQLAPLVPGSDSCALIVTSRHRLTVPGAKLIELDSLSEAAAVDLLVAVIGHDRVAAERDVAFELIRLCGGLPLALRIAGSRLNARPYWLLADMAGRLADERRRLDELTYGTLGVRASLGLSYEGLDEPARVLFRRLGWLGVPGVASWVAAALLDTGMDEVEEILGRLVDARLLEVRGRDPLGFVRYGFHELVRVQSRERALAEESHAALLAAAVRAFGGWLYLAEEAHRRESGGDYTLLHGSAPRWQPDPSVTANLLVDPLRWFESERHCLLDVIHRASVLDQDEVCWDLAITSVTLYEAGMYPDDWRQSHERALAAVRRRRNARGEAALLDSLGSLHMVQQRLDDARQLFEPALELFERVGERHGQALVMRNLAYLDRTRGQFHQAMQRYETAAALLRENGDVLGEAHVLGGMAQIHLELGDEASAEPVLRRSLDISLRLGSRRAESQARHRYGELLRRRGAFGQAEEEFRSALKLVRESRDPIGEAYALLGLGETLTHQERHPEAEEYLRGALRLAATIGEPVIEARTLLALGRQSRLRNRPDVAIAYLERARTVLDSVRAPHLQARVLAELGELYAATGRSDDARSTRRAAHLESERISPLDTD